MEIYWNFALILNFLVDFLLILGTNRISGYPFGVKRAILAALGGVVYAAGCFYPGFDFLRNGLWRVVSYFLMSTIAFGFDWTSVHRGVLFVFMNIVLWGISLGLDNRGFAAMLIGAIGVCLLFVLGFPGNPGQRYVPVEICHRGKHLTLTALVDTGNTLRDPVSNQAVLVADAVAAEKLLGLSVYDLSHPVETLGGGGHPGLRLIPYQSVGQSSGMLLGLRVEQIKVNGKKEKMVVAFAPQTIGQGRPYQALAGGMVS